jgi:hypothetical protein
VYSPADSALDSKLIRYTIWYKLNKTSKIGKSTLLVCEPVQLRQLSLAFQETFVLSPPLSHSEQLSLALQETLRLSLSLSLSLSLLSREYIAESLIISLHSRIVLRVGVVWAAALPSQRAIALIWLCAVAVVAA